MPTTGVVSRGIYHGLPTFPPAPGPYTAIITGANGISGAYMLRVLALSPQRWTKIYCLSRRPPLIEGGLPENAEHIAVDFLKTPEEIAGVLKGKGVAKVDYVFFFSYIQVEPKAGGGLWSDAEEMCRVNTLLLTNFLTSLPLFSPPLTPKRIMLQTGAKNYGVHLGPTKLPQTESDPRITLEPNFYYTQEEALFTYCTANNVGWNICMPGPIIGAVPDAAMNLAFPLAVYASVCKVLGEEMKYPGDKVSWQLNCSMSGSMMNAYLEEWAVLTPGARDERFNAFDGGAFTWEEAWGQVAGWFGVEWWMPEPGITDDGKEDWGEVTYSRFSPRFTYGGKGVVRRRFRLVDWARREDVKTAWGKIAEEHGLREKELRDVDRVFGFLDGSLCRPSPLLFSSSKARKLGFHGFVDSIESLREVMVELGTLKMIPPVPK